MKAPHVHVHEHAPHTFERIHAAEHAQYLGSVVTAVASIAAIEVSSEVGLMPVVDRILDIADILAQGRTQPESEHETEYASAA